MTAAAKGVHSNVVVNLKATEAIALSEHLRLWKPVDRDAEIAAEKCHEAADRAAIPWGQRT